MKRNGFKFIQKTKISPFRYNEQNLRKYNFMQEEQFIDLKRILLTPFFAVKTDINESTQNDLLIKYLNNNIINELAQNRDFFKRNNWDIESIKSWGRYEWLDAMFTAVEKNNMSYFSQLAVEIHFLSLKNLNISTHNPLNEEFKKKLISLFSSSDTNNYDLACQLFEGFSFIDESKLRDTLAELYEDRVKQAFVLACEALNEINEKENWLYERLEEIDKQIEQKQQQISTIKQNHFSNFFPKPMKEMIFNTFGKKAKEKINQVKQEIRELEVEYYQIREECESARTRASRFGRYVIESFMKDEVLRKMFFMND